MAITEPVMAAPWGKRVLWLILLWSASVGALGLVSLILKSWLAPRG